MKSQRLTFKKARDENEAIDQSDIIEGYAEPGDEEGLPGPNDGPSAVCR